METFVLICTLIATIVISMMISLVMGWIASVGFKIKHAINVTEVIAIAWFVEAFLLGGFVAVYLARNGII